MRTYEKKETQSPDLFRVVDRDGNWEHYFHQPSGLFLRGVTTILQKGYAKGANFEAWLSQHSQKERDEILQSAGDRGDMVHRTIEVLCSGEPKIERETEIFNRLTNEHRKLSNEEWDALLSWQSFWDAHDPVIYAFEEPMYSLKHSYAGTADVFWKLTKECSNKLCYCHKVVGKIGLSDYKTSSGIRDSYWSQLEAYARADNVKTLLPQGKKVEYTSVLRLGTAHKNGYEFKISEDRQGSWDRFLSAQIIAGCGYKGFDPAEIRDIPDMIEVKVEKYKKPSTLTKEEKAIIKAARDKETHAKVNK